MARIGYARTSTVDQIAGLEKQVQDLKAAHCDVIYQEHISAVSDEREAFQQAINSLKAGDVLVVTTMSRLCRRVSDLGSIQQTLEAEGASLEILDLKIDTSTAIGKMLLTVLGAVSQMERDLMRERQKVGIAKAKAEGAYKGRKATATGDSKVEEIRALQAKHPTLTKAQLAQLAGISQASLYRLLAKPYLKASM